MQNKIGSLLFKKIILWYILISIILTSLQIANEYYFHKNRLSNSLVTIQKIFSKPLSTAIWNLDREQVTNIVNAIIAQENIIGIKIIEPNENLMISKGIVSLNDKVFTNVFDIRYKDSPNEILANVTFYSSNIQIYDIMKNNITFIIINSMIKTFILLFLFLYFSDKIITKTLNRLISSINKTNLTDRDTVFLNEKDVIQNNELITLIKSYNSLQVRLEEELERNKQNHLELLQQSKMIALSDMLKNIAHQWRQPLSIISTIATGIKVQHELDILDYDQLDEQLTFINNNTQNLSNILNNFSNIFTKESTMQEVILQKKTEEIISLMSPSLQNNQINLINNINYTQHTKITIFVLELSEVLINIINNAIDIIVERKIEKPWIAIDLEEKEKQVIIIIEDNARGIEDDILPKIFEPYFTTKFKGQGIGLSLHMSYKIIVDLLKGKIYAKNTQYGVKFIIELPLIYK